MLDWLRKWARSWESPRLRRYRLACEEAFRYAAGADNVAAVAKWIHDRGEGTSQQTFEEFRASLK